MDPMKLGQRIKEARLSRKMTQNEVVGTFITRNMLSQIESGSASPSIKTLEYLSQVLEIPLSELMAEEEQAPSPSIHLAKDQTTDDYFSLKQHFLNNDYEKVSEWIENYLQDSHPFYDEGCAIYARTCLSLASSACKEGDLRKGLQLAKQASRYAQLGCYASRDINTQALLLLDSITEKL